MQTCVLSTVTCGQGCMQPHTFTSMLYVWTMRRDEKGWSHDLGNELFVSSLDRREGEVG